jgi:hypothetical protein
MTLNEYGMEFQGIRTFEIIKYLLIFREMSVIDKVISFITDESKIEITEKNNEHIMDKFFPDIKDKIIWFFEIDDEEYEGMINKKYDIIKTVYPEADVYFNGWSKERYYCKLKDIEFKYEMNTLKEVYDKGENYYKEQQMDEFDLVYFLYDNDIINVY